MKSQKGTAMSLVPVTSLEDPRLDAYLRLTEVQLRSRIEPERGIFIAESPKVIERALSAGYEALSFLMEERWLTEGAPLIAQAEAQAGRDLPVFSGPRELLERLTGFALTRGILCAMRRRPLPSVAELLADAHRVAILEGIVDHTNVGAIFRSAAGLGADAILVTPTCCDPLYRRAVRVSMGTVFQVPWTRIGEHASDWPSAGLAELQRLGFTTAALALRDDARTLDDPVLHSCDRLALIFGTEGEGLAPQTIASADYTVRIPMRHGVDSLNVAASSAVVFWELRKR
jgi:tRNA G18 (ribose-2'-O)-methylase SpoU